MHVLPNNFNKYVKKSLKILPRNGIRTLFLSSDFKTADKTDRVNENSP